MADNARRTDRTRTHAKVLWLDQAVPGYLRDLSRKGCKVALLKAVQVQPGEAARMRIIPGEESDIAPFEVLMEVLWTRGDPIWFFLGGLVVAPDSAADRECLQRLRGYYEQGEP
jgi:hypothetical protein